MTEQATATLPDGDWKQAPERSSLFWLRLMTWLSLKLGRRASRLVLYAIAAYFLAFAPTARRMSRSYLKRVLQLASPAQVPWKAMYRHFLCFASVIHDRIYLINDRHDLFDIRVHNQQLIDALLARGDGAFLIGAHLGSFEVLRAVGRKQPGLRIAMARDEEPARKIPRDIHEHARDIARSFVGTEDFEQSRRERKKIEMRFAHLKRILKLGRLRLRGPRGAQDEFVLAAIAQNLRRLASLVARPPPAGALCIA